MTPSTHADLSDSRLRVLQVVLNLDQGGLERLVPEIVRSLDPKRFESHVLCLEYPGGFAHRLEGFGQIHRAGELPPWAMLWPSRLISQIRAIAPNVVHSHSGVWYLASWAARRAGVGRIVHTDHGRQCPDPWKNRLVEWIASRRTNVVVAVSDALAEQLASTVVAHPSRIRVIPNGVDTDLYCPRPDDGAIRRETGIPAERPIIGTIGRLDAVKAYDDMLAAFALLLETWADSAPPVLVIAGDGPERDRLSALKRDLDLAGAVHLLGWRDDISTLHRSFTIFTLSSRSEGTSVSLLEAMSAGICPVVTDVGGNRAVLGTALHDRLVLPGNPQLLAAAWRAALMDSPGRRSDGAIARERVVQLFSLKRMVEAYQEVYVASDREFSHTENPTRRKGR